MNLKKVYFRIDVGYVWGKGISIELNTIFINEIKEILTNLGWGKWTKMFGHSSWECYRNENEYLYCHPMDIVGIMDIDNGAKEIEAALIESDVIKFRCFDPYKLTEKDLEKLVNLDR